MTVIYYKNYTNYGVDIGKINLVKETPTQIHGSRETTPECIYKFNKKSGREIPHDYKQRHIISEQEYTEIKNAKITIKVKSIDNDIEKLKLEIDELENKKIMLMEQMK